ncbi:MAG: erythromycin esterase family protein [Gammaproteobacteria bacterium]
MSSQRAEPGDVFKAAIPLDGGEHDYDALLDMIGEARFVLLGEATHGTHEFYAERARITQRLITEKGFTAVAVEADWPDAYRVNRYVRGQGRDASASQALNGFQRFPNWMWRNTDVVDLVDWMRAHNAARPPERRVGFYGLDLYSLFTSIEEVLRYLDEVDPKAAQEARKRYACFDQYQEDSQQYAYETGIGMSDSCEQGVVAQLQALQQRAGQYMSQEDSDAGDAFFYAQQNARLIKNAEEYYRTMFRGRVSSWNLRDRHMAETLDALQQHLSDGGEPARTAAKIVVWEHNSHIGDARATETGQLGEWNVGQLARERYGKDAFLLGFTTYTGWVMAASRWDGVGERKRVVPALPGSYEELFHQAQLKRFLLPLAHGSSAAKALKQRRLERAIGVLYLPHTERQSHYFHADLAAQFDAVIHIDETEAVEALEPVPRDDGSGEVPETYPAGV